MIIHRVISGGQTGVDTGALCAAADYGLETGGWAPKGFMTEIGPRPHLLKHFGLVEHKSPKYSPRTAANIHEASFTLILTTSLKLHGGSALTRDLCFKMKKPMFHFDLTDEDPVSLEELCRWVYRRHIRKPSTMNVAGSRESSSPGIQARSEKFLLGFFGALYFF